MKYFPSWITRIWALNRLYRYAMAHYPGYALRKFGGTLAFPLERLGSDYGGWYTPTHDLNEDSVVYSAGIGQDITFDKAIIEKCGCKVFGFDPTAHACNFIAEQFKSQTLSPQFIFSPVGLWDSETTLLFFAPKTRGWVGSYSALNLQGTSDDEAVSLPVKRLSVLMQENGHQHIDFLKMDIEGAEYRVIEEIIEKQIPITWLAIEFDQPVPFWTTNKALQRLRESGFELCKVDRWNFVFCNRRQLKATPMA